MLIAVVAGVASPTTAAAPVLIGPSAASAPAARMGYDSDRSHGSIVLAGSDQYTQLIAHCTVVRQGSSYRLLIRLTAFLDNAGPQSPDESFISFLVTGGTAFDDAVEDSVDITVQLTGEAASTSMSSPVRIGSPPREFQAQIDVDKWVYTTETLFVFDVGDHYQVAVPCT